MTNPSLAVPLAVGLLLTTGTLSDCAITSVKGNAALVPELLLAVRFTTNDPDALGIPEMAPVDGLRVRPAGRLDAPNDVGELLAKIVYPAKGEPARALAVAELVMTGTGCCTVRMSVASAVPPALVAPIVTTKMPAAVGVPVIAPDVGLNPRPAGRPEALKLVGLFDAAIVYANGDPSVPAAVNPLTIVGGSITGLTIRTALLLAMPNPLLTATV